MTANLLRQSSRRALVLLLALGFSAGIAAADNPSIFNLNPSSIASGSANFSLAVFGVNFSTTSTVYWNATPLPTTFLSSSSLIATVTSGLLTNPGVVSIFVATPTLSNSNSLLFTISPSVTISATSLPNGAIGTPYSYTLNATGGVPPYRWSATGGLPPGLTVGIGGTITGTPTTAGTYSVGIAVFDNANVTSSKALSLVITQPSLVISNASPLPAATLNQPYTVTFAATGGVVPLTWAVSGTLPQGLSLATSTGVFSGTPVIAGTYSFTIQVTDGSQTVANKIVSLTVNPPALNITTVAPLFTGTVGTTYAQPFSASGGTPPYRWSLVSGSVGGLALDATSGTLQGTPQTAGTFLLTVQVADNSGATASKAFSLVVNAQTVSITTVSPLPNAAVGASYSQTFLAVGGKQPYNWSLISGSIPGLLLNGSSGVLSGTPTTPGTGSFTIQVNDSSGLTATKNFTLAVNAAALIITTDTTLPSPSVGTPFSQTITAAGGVLPYTWSANGLPAGLNLDGSTGILSGTPTVGGSFSFTVRVSDNARTTVVNLFQITIGLPALPGVHISGIPSTVAPASQVPIGMTLDSAYAGDLSGQLILSFAPDSGPGDSTIQFTTGGSSLKFTIPAGQTTATFPADTVLVQTGTVAGTIIVTAQIQSGGVDITPAPAPTGTGHVDRAAPVITSAKIIRASSGFSIEVVGYSTAREVTQATFKFHASSSQTLQTGQVDVTVGPLFTTWFQGSGQYGSQFTYTQPFNVQGDSSAVTPDSVTLINRVGSSTTISVSQ